MIEVFKQKYPKLSEIIGLAIDCGLDVEHDINDANRVISWYNNCLQTHIRLEMTSNNGNILNSPFLVELKKDDLNTITLCEYIFSKIGETPIEAADCTPFIFRTSNSEYTMNTDFKISKWNFIVSKYDRLLSNGQKYTDVLKDILTNKNTRNELIENYNAADLDLIELYKLLHELTNSQRTDWQILKFLEQSNFFNYIYSEFLIPFLFDKGEKEYIEMTEILYS